MKKFIFSIFFFTLFLPNWTYASDVVVSPHFNVDANSVKISALFNNSPVSITLENGCNYPIIRNDSVSVGAMESYSLSMNSINFTSCSDVRFTVGGVDKVFALRDLPGYSDVISFINNHSNNNNSQSSQSGGTQSNDFMDTPYFAFEGNDNEHWAIMARFHGDQSVSVYLEGNGGGMTSSGCSYRLAFDQHIDDGFLVMFWIDKNYNLTNCSRVKFISNIGGSTHTKVFPLSQLSHYSEALAHYSGSSQQGGSNANGNTNQLLTTSYVGLPTATLKQTNTNPKHWFYEINLKFNRSRNEDVYLIAQRTPEDGGQQEYTTLCHIPSGNSSPITISYPDGTNHNCDSSPIDNDFFRAGNDYVFYLSNQANGVLNLDSDMTLIPQDREISQNSSFSSGNGNSVSFDIGESSFARSVKDGKEIWGLRIVSQSGGMIQRQRDETIYLILAESAQGGVGKRKALCEFKGGSGLNSFSGPNFPGCYVRDSHKLFNFDGDDYGIIDIIEQGKDYSVFFSSDLNGSNVISSVKSIGTAIPRTSIVVDPDISVEIKQDTNGGYYYHIEGDVKKDHPANFPQNTELHFDILNENQITTTISDITPNPVFYRKGVHFALDTPILDEGNYALHIKTSKGTINSIDLQTIPLPRIGQGGNSQTNVGTAGGNTNQYNGVNSLASGNDPYSDYKGIGNDDEQLVPLDCGYNLGKGGRMCVLSDFIRMIRRVISYIFIITVPIAAIVFAYAGFQLLFSGGNTTKRDAAKRAVKNLLIGIAVFLLAWVGINLLISTLGIQSDFNIFFGK